jgi:UDP-glucose 4-epimerase
MTDLVTGGAGFIGSHLVRGLLEKGRAVRVLDDFSTGRRENLADVDGDLEIMEGDVRDAAKVREALRSVERVFHEAAFVSVPASMEDPAECLDVNVRGTGVLLSAARQAGVRRVVLASSAAVYGDSTFIPNRESAIPAPRSAYAVSKRVNEMYAGLFAREHGLEVVALRYFNVYGPGQRLGSIYAAAIPIFIQRLLDGKPIVIHGDGGQSRDLIHVKDVVRANLIACEHPGVSGQVFNVCTGTETQIIEVVRILLSLFPTHREPEHTAPRGGDVYRSFGDASRAAAELGFRSEVPLPAGLTETVGWMRAA